EVSAVGEDCEARLGEGLDDLAGDGRAADEVPVAREDERRRGDGPELCAQVERRHDLSVEERQRLRAGNLPDALEVRPLLVAEAREVERELAKRDLPELLVAVVASSLLVREGCPSVGIPGFLRERREDVVRR